MASLSGDFFDSLLNKTCSILEMGAGSADAYGQESEAFATLLANWPCAIAADAPGRAEEFRSEKLAARNHRRVFMRVPTLSTGKQLNQHHWLLIDGTYYNIVDVLNPGGLDHHLEVITEHLIGS